MPNTQCILQYLHGVYDCLELRSGQSLFLNTLLQHVLVVYSRGAHTAERGGFYQFVWMLVSLVHRLKLLGDVLRINFSSCISTRSLASTN